MKSPKLKVAFKHTDPRAHIGTKDEPKKTAHILTSPLGHWQATCAAPCFPNTHKESHLLSSESIKYK